MRVLPRTYRLGLGLGRFLSMSVRPIGWDLTRETAMIKKCAQLI